MTIKHFANACRSKHKNIGENTTKDVVESNTVFHKKCQISVTCTVSSQKTSQRAVVIDHNISDDRKGVIARQLPPQPTVYLTTSAHKKESEYDLHTRTRQITAAMAAFIGCQSVLFGIKILHRMGFKKSDLIALKTKKSAMNRDVISFLGAVNLRLSSKSGSGKVLEREQI